MTNPTHSNRRTSLSVVYLLRPFCTNSNPSSSTTRSSLSLGAVAGVGASPISSSSSSSSSSSLDPASCSTSSTFGGSGEFRGITKNRWCSISTVANVPSVISFLNIMTWRATYPFRQSHERTRAGRHTSKALSSSKFTSNSSSMTCSSRYSIVSSFASGSSLHRSAITPHSQSRLSLLSGPPQPHATASRRGCQKLRISETPSSHFSVWRGVNRAGCATELMVVAEAIAGW